MIQEGVTWLVTASGETMRVFEERQRHGPLAERADLGLEINEDDRRLPRMTRATGHGAGPARHDIREIARPQDRAEERFLARAARTLSKAAAAGGCDHLVLMAAPKVLGLLRAGLEPQAAAKVRLTEDHDRSLEDASILKRRLHDLRMP